MFNITQLLLTIDDSIAWNRKLPSVLKSFEERSDEHKLASLTGGKWEKINNDFFVKKTLTASVLFALSKTIKDELLSLKVQLKAENFNSQILEHKNRERAKKENQIYEAVNVGKWESYYSDTIDKISQAQEEHLLDIYKEALLVISNYTTIAMVRTRFTEFRKMIDERLSGELKEQTLKFFSLPATLNNAINDKVDRENKQRLKSSDRTVLKIRNIRRVIDDYSKELLNVRNISNLSLPARSEYIAKCLIYLALTTGRRPIEILSVGTFAPVEKKPNYLTFSGQAKIKSQARAEEFSIEVPLLFSNYEDVKYIRSLLHSMMNRHLNKSKSEVSKFVSPMIDRHWTNFTTTYEMELRHKLSSLRSVYAVTCEKIYNQSLDNQIAQKVYIGNILGHLDYGEDWEHYYDFTLDGRGVDIKRYLAIFRKDNKE